MFVTEGPEETGLVDVRDAGTGESVLAFVGHEIDLNDVAFTADGTAFATTGDDGRLRVWDPETGEELADLGGGDGQRDGAVVQSRRSAGRRLLGDRGGSFGCSIVARGAAVGDGLGRRLGNRLLGGRHATGGRLVDQEAAWSSSTQER